MHQILRGKKLRVIRGISLQILRYTYQITITLGYLVIKMFKII